MSKRKVRKPTIDKDAEKLSHSTGTSGKARWRSDSTAECSNFFIKF